MNKAQIINVNGAHNKWIKLIMYFRHAGKPLYECTFPDAQTAKHARSCLHNAATYEGCHMVVTRKDCTVYVFNPIFAQKVVINDG